MRRTLLVALFLVVAVAFVAGLVIVFGLPARTTPTPQVLFSVPALTAGAESAPPSIPLDPAGVACSDQPAGGVDAPLADYGDQDSATLRLIGGAPPTALLCATFDGNTIRQHGSAPAKPGHLGYLLGLINTSKGNGAGGGYYWIAGAVDGAVTSVVLTYTDTILPPKLILVPLTAGWRGFADEYSPGPVLSQAGTVPSLIVTARDHNGTTIDAASINLGTGAVRKINTAARCRNRPVDVPSLDRTCYRAGVPMPQPEPPEL